MRKSIVGLYGLALATGLVAGPASFAAADAATPARTPAAPSAQGSAELVAGSDELPNPLESKRRALKEAGLTAVV